MSYGIQQMEHNKLIAERLNTDDIEDFYILKKLHISRRTLLASRS